MDIESLVDPQYANSLDARLASSEAYIEYQIQEGRRAIPFLSRFLTLRDARLLELGSGRGGKGIAYACEGARVTSLDIDLGALSQGQRAAHVRGAVIQFVGADGSFLPFPGGTFDAVLLDSVLEHVTRPGSVLQECARVLRAGGIALVVFPPFYGPLSGHLDDFVPLPWFHVLPRTMVRDYMLATPRQKGILSAREAFDVYCTLNRLTIRRFRRVARQAGFRVEHATVRPFLTHPGNRLIAGLYAALKQRRGWQGVPAVLARARKEFDLGTLLLFFLLSAIAPLVRVPWLQEVAAGGCKYVLRKA